jgi:hypothetical protein
MKPRIICTLVFAGAILAGILVPSTPASAFADPKATPTPNPCCELIFSRYCLLCPAK